MARSLFGNRAAFADMIAACEGTAKIGDGGYNVLLGSTPEHPLLFASYADHPRIFNKQFHSTAAGRYQLLAHYFDAYKTILHLKDFSPAAQDAIAMQQCAEKGALKYIDTGYLADAIGRVRHIWASLPGAGYGQREQPINFCFAAYEAAGGSVAI